LGGAYEESQPSARRKKASGHWKYVSEALYGAQSDYIEGLRNGLSAGIQYIDIRQCKRASHFPKERGFLVVGLNERQGYVRSPEFYRNSREAGTGSNVDDAQSKAWLRLRAERNCLHMSSGGKEMAGGEERFAEVAGDDLFWIADGGKVDASIPMQQYIDICRYIFELSSGQDSRFLAEPLALFGVTRTWSHGQERR
jgi:hypothetical protein